MPCNLCNICLRNYLFFCNSSTIQRHLQQRMICVVSLLLFSFRLYYLVFACFFWSPLLVSLLLVLSFLFLSLFSACFYSSLLIFSCFSSLLASTRLCSFLLVSSLPCLLSPLLVSSFHFSSCLVSSHQMCIYTLLPINSY